MTSYYCVDESEPHHMPWLHGDGIALMDAETVLWTLCREIRRVVLTPGARGKSPLSQMRDEVARILDCTTDSIDRIDSRHSSPVLSTLDDVSIFLLGGRGRNTGFDRETWREIAPHITPELFEAMMDESLDLERFHLDVMPLLQPEVGRLLRQRCSDHPHWSSLIKRFAQAAQERVLPGEYAVEVLTHFLERQNDTAWRSSRAHAVIHDDATLYLACSRITGKGWDHGLEQIGNPDTRRLCSLANSAHGRMRIFAAIPDVAEFIARPKPVIKILLE